MKTIKLFFCAVILQGAITANAQTWDIGYPNPEDVKATFSDGTLTISGEGAMQDFAIYYHVPWYNVMSSIETLVIEEGITSIGNYAFYECNFTSVTIPGNVTMIGNRAFYRCRSLTSLTILEGVKTIGDHAFAESGLTSVTIPEGVETIGESAFFSCNLTSLIIPESVTTIGGGAFWNCRLTSIVIPEKVTTIGYYAFYGCTNLISINVSNSNPNYSSEDGILYDKNKTTLICCPGAKTDAVIIPEGVTTIEQGAFWYYSRITSLTIPESLTTIEKGTFSFCGYLRTINVSNSNPNYSSEDGMLYDKNKTTLIQCPAEGFGTLTIPESVTTIEERMYRGGGLTSLIISENVATIGDYAFGGNTFGSVFNLAIIPQTINRNVFPDLTLNNIPLYVPEESLALYQEAEVWQDFNIISYSAIETWNIGYPNAEDVKATLSGGTLTVSGKGAMQDFEKGAAPWYDIRSSITNLVINEEITTIGDWAFYYCSSLNSVIIPGNVKTIGNGAFETCWGLIPTILEGVTTIGEGAFQNSRALTSLVLPEGVTTIKKETFQHCRRLISVTFPESLTTIGDWAFYYCTDLTSITIPEGVTTIGSRAFVLCSSLNSVTLPENITTIGTFAFGSCSGLQSVSVSWKEPFDISELNLFQLVNLSAVRLTVPYGTKALYEAAPVWQDFGIIVEKANINVTPDKPAGADGEGSISIVLEIPVNTLFTGSFYIQLPEGFTLNMEKTCLSGDLVSLLDLTITPEEDNKWLITIFLRPEEPSLRSTTDFAYTQIMNIIYNVEESVESGSYQAVISDLNFEFEDGTTIVEDKISAAVLVDRSYVGIKGIESETKIYVFDNKLFITTPQSEMIYLYSLSGQLEYSGRKEAGTVVIPLRQNTNPILIVKGNSGWVRKVVR